MLNITKDFIYGRLMMIKKKIMESREKVEKVFNEHEKLKIVIAGCNHPRSILSYHGICCHEDNI
jgi:hypothetical protein